MFIGSHNIKLRETTEVPRRITIAHTLYIAETNSFFEKFTSKRVDPRVPMDARCWVRWSYGGIEGWLLKAHSGIGDILKFLG